MDLEAIPGIGAKTAAALADLDDPAGALRRGDVVALSAAPGITTGRAVTLVRATHRHRHGEDAPVIATDRARELHETVLARLRDHTVTDHAAARLATLYPSASRDRIAETRAFAESALEVPTDAAVEDPLADVAPLGTPPAVRVRERCVATGSDDRAEAARGAVPELSVERVDTARDVADLAGGYGVVTVLDGAYAGKEFPGDVRVRPDALAEPWRLVPERSLAFVGHNRDRITAALEVHRRADLEVPCDPEAIEAVLAGVDTDGTLVGDDELQRLRRACDDLDAAVSTATSVANDHLRAAMRERDVTVEGADLLELAERGAGVESLVDRELAEEFETAIDRALEHAVDALGLTDDEARAVAEVFPTDVRFPIERDEAVYERVADRLEADRDRLRERRLLARAEAIEARRDDIEALVAQALEFDAKRAIACFAQSYGCTMPTLDDAGIHLEAARPLTLDLPADELEPVTYDVEGVTLLTGVNSGGKTTVLELVATTVILAQMGLPVPAASATVAPVDRLYYHAKPGGTLDAGAFETTLRDFAALTRAEENSLVLVDELESITEPGASAKVIAGFLEALAQRSRTAVFVTHLAAEIEAEAGIDLAIDGIEARGLEDGELVVDRSPRKGHLARSTPELIVEKLAEAEPEVELYRRLLAKFDAGPKA